MLNGTIRMDICNRTRLTAPSMIDDELGVNAKLLIQLSLWNHGDTMQIIRAILVQAIGYAVTNLPNVCLLYTSIPKFCV